MTGRSWRADAIQVLAVANARWRLRTADARGVRVRLWGRPRVVNEGRMMIGDRVRLGSRLAPIELVAAGSGVLEIGAGTFINFGTSIVANQHVHVGADCNIGPHCIVMDNSYHRLEPERRTETPPSRPVHLGDNVWLGARTIVLPGVTIGDHSVIAAGSVVTGDIPSRVLAGGVPARVIRTI